MKCLIAAGIPGDHLQVIFSYYVDIFYEETVVV
jgi:hypothetical protein